MASRLLLLVVITSVLLHDISAHTALEIEKEIEKIVNEIEDAAEKRAYPAEESQAVTNEKKSEKELRALVSPDSTSQIDIKATVVKAFDAGFKQLEEDDELKLFYFKTEIDTTTQKNQRHTTESLSGLNNQAANFKKLEAEERDAIPTIVATKTLLESGLFKNLEHLQGNSEVLSLFQDLQPFCLEKVPYCGKAQAMSPYRTITGVCNNLDHPKWGSTRTPQQRLISPQYQDGVNAIRTLGVNGAPLPSARHLSINILRDPSDIPTPDDPFRTVMMMVVGQVLDHDITETPQSQGYGGSNIGCCAITNSLARSRRSQCAPIDIDPATDHYFNHTCMNFVRSLPVRSHNRCTPTVRQQINAITAFVDCSQVYGSDDDVAMDLRTHVHGKMKVEADDMLPRNDDSACVLTDPGTTHCLLAGDVRVNENPALVTIHTVFVRFHNLLADRLVSLGVSDDQTIYNIVRKIMGALFQNIVYGQWLPSVIGQQAMDHWHLTIGHPYAYNQFLNPSIFNSFAAAALRYGHTLIGPEMLQLHENLITSVTFPLEENFFRPDMVFTDVSSLARWMAFFRCKKADAKFTDSVQDLLFQSQLSTMSLDLPALNIQRGRDHGLPGYSAFRDACGLSVPTDFNDLEHHTTHFKNALSAHYDDVRDIDLFVGAMTETNVADAHLGPTFSCILARQFYNLKFGDRYWFENPEPTGFTNAQRNNIKDVRLAKLMCEVLPLPLIQENVFAVPGLQDLVDCSTLADIDMNLFTP